MCFYNLMSRFIRAIRAIIRERIIKIIRIIRIIRFYQGSKGLLEKEFQAGNVLLTLRLDVLGDKLL